MNHVKKIKKIILQTNFAMFFLGGFPCFFSDVLMARSKKTTLFFCLVHFFSVFAGHYASTFSDLAFSELSDPSTESGSVNICLAKWKMMWKSSSWIIIIDHRSSSSSSSIIDHRSSIIDHHHHHHHHHRSSIIDHRSSIIIIIIIIDHRSSIIDHHHHHHRSSIIDHRSSIIDHHHHHRSSIIDHRSSIIIIIIDHRSSIIDHHHHHRSSIIDHRSSIIIIIIIIDHRSSIIDHRSSIIDHHHHHRSSIIDHRSSSSSSSIIDHRSSIIDHHHHHHHHHHEQQPHHHHHHEQQPHHRQQQQQHHRPFQVTKNLGFVVVLDSLARFICNIQLFGWQESGCHRLWWRLSLPWSHPSHPMPLLHAKHKYYHHIYIYDHEHKIKKIVLPIYCSGPTPNMKCGWNHLVPEQHVNVAIGPWCVQLRKYVSAHLGYPWNFNDFIAHRNLICLLSGSFEANL